jgi:UDP-N-acetylmuramate: L-alanyl-gamma-D-glutamyl-meso-diaminopimelate ligase|tara:strand:- start:1668 stop:3029 length:1362 start_codon:yes stop_codon:yes gene_type:complete
MVKKRVHILGICGTFMGGLALLARESGFQVSGCDENVYPPMSEHLADEGIEIISGYKLADLPEADIYLVGNAMSRGNEIIEYLLNTKANIVSGPEWVYENILKEKKVIAVSGTHGKTSTTAMIAWIFEYVGKDIGYLIAGKPKDFKASSRLGTENIFVIEADEYDTAFFDKRAKFVHYHPDVLIINNLEFDHADIYKDLSAIQTQFHHLIRSMPQNSLIIYPEEDLNVGSLMQQGSWSETKSYSANRNSKNYYVPLSSDFSSVKFTLEQEQGVLEWSMLGAHNAQNAFCSILACQKFGLPLKKILEALKEFQGVSRRQDLLFNKHGKVLIDDFAHHPTAIKSTLEGIREKYKDHRIIALIELRSNTMKSGLHDKSFANSTKSADKVYWKGQDRRQLEIICNLNSSESSIIESIEDTVSEIINDLHGEELLVTMSNGGFDGITSKLLESLENAN